KRPYFGSPPDFAPVVAAAFMPTWHTSLYPSSCFCSLEFARDRPDSQSASAIGIGVARCSAPRRHHQDSEGQTAHTSRAEHSSILSRHLQVVSQRDGHSGDRVVDFLRNSVRRLCDRRSCRTHDSYDRDRRPSELVRGCSRGRLSLSAWTLLPCSWRARRSQFVRRPR